MRQKVGNNFRRCSQYTQFITLHFFNGKTEEVARLRIAWEELIVREIYNVKYINLMSSKINKRVLLLSFISLSFSFYLAI